MHTRSLGEANGYCQTKPDWVTSAAFNTDSWCCIAIQDDCEDPPAVK